MPQSFYGITVVIWLFIKDVCFSFLLYPQLKRFVQHVFSLLEHLWGIVYHSAFYLLEAVDCSKHSLIHDEEIRIHPPWTISDPLTLYIYLPSQLIKLIRKDKHAARCRVCVVCLCHRPCMKLGLMGLKLTREHCRLGIPESFEESQRDMKG